MKTLEVNWAVVHVGEGHAETHNGWFLFFLDVGVLDSVFYE
jgi:hypothetical protein